MFTLIVDRPDDNVDYDAQPFTTTFASELDIPAFPSFAFRYSILELNTAVKPFYLQALHLQQGLKNLCYFDPDILVTGHLDPLYGMLEESAEIILTPHILEPIEDKATPSERSFLLSGIYNLGFLGIRFNKRTLSFLEWWQRRLYKHCHHRVDQGLFVDQRWMDFAPAFLERVSILRDPGYNVAYWNLMHRTLRPKPDGWSVDGSALRFFHFSGFSPDSPDQLSKYQNRIDLAHREDLEPLFREYARRLRDEGWAHCRDLPYGFSCFDSGVSIPPIARRILDQTDPDGERWPDPFATDSGASFCNWLVSPPEPEPPLPVPRLAQAVWDERPDLQEAFPNPMGSDIQGFARWLVESASKELSLDPYFLTPLHEQYFSKAGYSAKERVRESFRTKVGRNLRKLLPSAYVGEAWEEALSSDEVAFLGEEGLLDSRSQPLISRLAYWLYEQRPDIQRSFPEPLGRDRERFAMWFATHGRVEYKLPRAVIKPVLRSFSIRRRLWVELWWLRNRAGAFRLI